MTSTSGSLRQIMYFAGDGIGRYWLTLALWAITCLALTLAYDAIKARHTAHRNETTALPRQTTEPAPTH